MEVHTTQPGVQLYTGNNLADPFPVHGSVSLETQAFPDSPKGQEAASRAFVVGNLQIGMVAPDIEGEDLDGVQFHTTVGNHGYFQGGFTFGGSLGSFQRKSRRSEW